MPAEKEKKSISSASRVSPILPTRIQTAEGWKRSQVRKRKSSKTASKS